MFNYQRNSVAVSRGRLLHILTNFLLNSPTLLLGDCGADLLVPSLLDCGALLLGPRLQDHLALLVKHLPALLGEAGPADVPTAGLIALLAGLDLLTPLLNLLVQHVHTDRPQHRLVNHPADRLHLEDLLGAAVSLRDGDVDTLALLVPDRVVDSLTVALLLHPALLVKPAALHRLSIMAWLINHEDIACLITDTDLVSVTFLQRTSCTRPHSCSSVSTHTFDSTS